MKFLIDECLSPKLAEFAQNNGFPESTHINGINMRSAPDDDIVRRAVTDGYVIVTNNTGDFVRLLEQEEGHPGLICIETTPRLMNLNTQTRLFLYALDQLGDREPENEVIQIVLNRIQEVVIRRYEWPPTS